MLRYVKTHSDVAYIIVYSFDRFSRTGVSGSHITEQLKQRGTMVVSATQEVDATTSSGTFQQNLFFLFSKFDNELRRDKAVSGSREKLRKGYIHGVVPFGYDNLNPGKGKIPQLVINKQGRLLQQAFELKANHNMSYVEIAMRLEKFGWTKAPKRLGDLMRKPIYCGIIVSSHIPGEVIEGKHPPITTKEIFLKANSLIVYRYAGNRFTLDDEKLPLKRFVFSEKHGSPYTGYLVKKKDLYYYKSNTKGDKENRNAEIMHDEFFRHLQEFKIQDPASKELVTQLVTQTFVKLLEQSLIAINACEQRMSELESNLEKIEKRFVLGEIDRDLYLKYRGQFDLEVSKMRSEMEESRFNLSNLENAAEKAVNYALNLPEIWISGNLEEKRKLQSLIHPEGIFYNHEKHVYRTKRLNTAFHAIALLQRDSEQNKNGTNSKSLNLSRLVPKEGIEPSLFRTRV